MRNAFDGLKNKLGTAEDRNSTHEGEGRSVEIKLKHRGKKSPENSRAVKQYQTLLLEFLREKNEQKEERERKGKERKKKMSQRYLERQWSKFSKINERHHAENSRQDKYK